MSQSPLARKSRKSLTAFARPPSKLSKSQTADQLYAEADTFSPGKPNSPIKSSSASVATSTSTGTSPSSTPTQNAFATPPRKRVSEGGQWDSPTPKYATPIRGMTNRRVSMFSPGTYTPPYAGVRPAERRTSYGSNLGTPVPGTPKDGSPTGTPRATGTRKRFVRRKGVLQRYV